jgi:hypothetical protein
MLLGFILGLMMEEFFWRALLVSRGNFMVFFESPTRSANEITPPQLAASFGMSAFGTNRRCQRCENGSGIDVKGAAGSTGDASGVDPDLPTCPAFPPRVRLGGH